MSTSFSFYDRCERPWPNRRLKNAVIIGHTTPTTAKLWIRTREAGKYLLCLTPIALGENEKERRFNQLVDAKTFPQKKITAAFPKAITKEMNTAADKDFTAVHEFTGLAPYQRYRYFLAKVEKNGLRVIVDAIPYGANRQGMKAKIGSAGLSFRTLRAEAEKPFSFGLFSCHNPYIETDEDDSVVDIANMSAWDSLGRTLRRHSIDETHGKELAFIIAGGDQCYTDGRPKIDIWNYLYKVMNKQGGKLSPSKDDMLSWYRDIYRAYWGFGQVRSVYGMYPTYMIWDDHEICDGWGSYEPPSSKKRRHPIYEKVADKGMTEADATKLLDRMFAAACQVYDEYEHSHNPATKPGKWHYSFQHGKAHFFVMDGRGHRDINRQKFRVLGEAQLNDFIQYVGGVKDDELLFVVSAVPMLHTEAFVTTLGARFSRGNADDLKDSWEHKLHREEKGKIMECLWAASKRGVRICFLSGDVHASALFRIKNNGAGYNNIYQITSSAITYHLPWLMQLGARAIVTDEGEFDKQSAFNREAFFAKSSYAMVKVQPDSGDVIVSFYDATQKIPIDRREVEPKAAKEFSGGNMAINSSIGRHRLVWRD